MAIDSPSQTGESLVTNSLRRFVEGLSDATILVSRDHRVLYANGEARVRFSRADLTENSNFGAVLEQLFPETNWSEIAPVLTELLEAEDPEPRLFFLSHGVKQTHMRASALTFDADCHCGALENVLGLTFFDPDTDAIMRRLEFVLDSSTDGIFIVNRSNHIVYFNKACEKMTGWQKNAAIMQTYECANVLRCHNDAGESMASEALCPAKVFFHKDSEPKPHEMLITTTAGKERYVETNYSPIKNTTGEVEFIVGIIRDIDERKRLESQLVQNRNLALLGQLVSGIAHEIKNPLGILMSSAEIVLNEKRPAAQRREAATYLRDEVRRLDERMKDFLVFAKPKALMVEEVDVAQLVKRTASGYQASLRNKKFHVVPQMCSHTPATQADPDLLFQVFLNLIINADQAMPEGGVLTITTDVVDDAIRLRFIDAGNGIRDEDLPKIFDPFFTTKAGGTGLGLSVVHQIVTSHRGKMNVHNNDGKPGVTFEVLLPIVQNGSAT
ncbi:MAG: two-component system sensor histidine kinase NtrB [Candidatus Sumerlaeaceae bacterium]